LTYARPQPNLYQPLTATHFQLNLGQAQFVDKEAAFLETIGTHEEVN
jgi:hypothetical protein